MIFKKSSGVITVFIALMLTGVLSLGTLTLEAGRLQVAKTQLASANNSAATSMIASYDQFLYDRYGLLAIDNKKFTPERCMDYLRFNSDLASGYSGNNIGTMYRLKTAEIEGVYNLTYPAILKRQILSRSNFHIVPTDFSLNQNNVIFVFAELKAKLLAVKNYITSSANGYNARGSIADVSPQMISALELLYETFKSNKMFDEKARVTISSSSVSQLPSVTGTIESTIPTEDIAAINAAVSDAQSVLGTNGVLLVSGGASQYSETEVSFSSGYISSMFAKASNLNNLPSSAYSVASDCLNIVNSLLGVLNTLEAEIENNALLNLYISAYFPCRNFGVDGYSGPVKGGNASGSDMTFSSACVEYVLGGKSSEINNQEIAYQCIVATRIVNNLYLTITNSSAFNSGNATNVAAHILWALFESYIDAELLAKYNATVPFEKYDLILPVNSAESVSTAFNSKDFFRGIDELGIYNGSNFIISGADSTNYRDALNLALWTVPNSKKMMRTADLIQLEMRYRQRYVINESATFKMGEMNTYCRVKTGATLNSVLPVIVPNGNGSTDGLSFQSIRYVGY